MEEGTFKQRPRRMKKRCQPCKEWEKSAVKSLQAKGPYVLRLQGGGESLEHVRAERRPLWFRTGDKGGGEFNERVGEEGRADHAGPRRP